MSVKRRCPLCRRPFLAGEAVCWSCACSLERTELDEVKSDYWRREMAAFHRWAGKLEAEIRAYVEGPVRPMCTRPDCEAPSDHEGPCVTLGTR